MSDQWFKAETLIRPTIVAVEVVKVTPKMITYIDESYSNRLVETRSARESGDQAFFPAWNEAHEWLMQKAVNELQRARHRLARAQAKHGNVKGMKPPTT